MYLNYDESYPEQDYNLRRTAEVVLEHRVGNQIWAMTYEEKEDGIRKIIHTEILPFLQMLKLLSEQGVIT